MTAKMIERRPSRRLAGVTALIAVVGVTSTAWAAQSLGGSAHAAPAVAVAAAGTGTSPPATDPAIQRWFDGNERARIMFDNELYRAEQAVASRSGTAGCSALVTATATMRADLVRLRAIPNGGPAIADAYDPALAEFTAAASACVHGDYASASELLGNSTTGAIGDYGAAQRKVDEILDAGA